MHRPLTSLAHAGPARGVRFSSDPCPREPDRLPCGGAVDQPPASLPASPLRQGDAAFQGGLQASELLKDLDIPLENGLLDPGYLAAHLRVELARAGLPGPVVEHRLGAIQLLSGPGDSDDFDPAAALPERLPQFTVRRSPRAERCSGLVEVAMVSWTADRAAGCGNSREGGSGGVGEGAEPEDRLVPGARGGAVALT